jgi:LysM repeat protein
MFATGTTKTLGILLAVLALVLVFGLRSAPPSQGSSPHAVHVVEPGDTLWGIAEATYDGDPRQAVHRLQEANDLSDATLVVGQELVLPLP